ncbi:hypothetical protein D3C73_910580 [compost metagenome]
MHADAPRHIAPLGVLDDVFRRAVRINPIGHLDALIAVQLDVKRLVRGRGAAMTQVTVVDRKKFYLYQLPVDHRTAAAVGLVSHVAEEHHIAAQRAVINISAMREGHAGFDGADLDEFELEMLRRVILVVSKLKTISGVVHIHPTFVRPEYAHANARNATLIHVFVTRHRFRTRLQTIFEPLADGVALEIGNPLVDRFLVDRAAYRRVARWLHFFQVLRGNGRRQGQSGTFRPNRASRRHQQGEAKGRQSQRYFHDAESCGENCWTDVHGNSSCG